MSSLTDSTVAPSSLPPTNGSDNPIVEESNVCHHYNGNCAQLIVFTLLEVLLMIFVLVSNVMVITLITRTKALRTSGNYQIISLCVANLAAGLLLVPSTILNHLTDDTDGIFCKSCQYFVHLADTAEVYTLVAIAYERFRTMITLNQGHVNTGRAIRGIVLIWNLAIFYALRAPFLYENYERSLGQSSGHVTTTTICAPLKDWPGYVIAETFVVVDFVVLFFAPVLIISVLYLIIVKKSKQSSNLSVKDSSRRLQVFKTASLLVGIFVVCSLPHYSLELYVSFGPGPFEGEALLKKTFELIAFMNFGMNPIVYALHRRNFRDALRRMLRITNSVAPVSGPRKTEESLANGSIDAGRIAPSSS